MREKIIAESWNELFHKLKDYFNQYPVAGYGTRIEYMKEEGIYIAGIVRGLNCD